MRSRGWAATVVCALAACGDGGGGGSAADAAAGGPDGAVDEDASAYFDEAVIRTYELDLASADWEWLQDNARLEQYVPATLRVDGETYAQVGLRFKGSVGSLALCFDADGNQTCAKLSMKVSLHEYVPGQRFHGLKKLNFHAMEADPSKMHDAIGYKLFRDHGVPAPRTAYARVVVNGEPQGLFALVEQIDGRFTRDRFADGGAGNLYKEVWPQHLTEQPYLDALETNEDEAPSADKMRRFAQALADAGDAGFADVVGAWMDVDQLMTYMAIARLIDHWDDVVAWYCGPGGGCGNHNYYWYEHTDADRVTLIAWDVDHTFEEPSPVRTYFSMPDWDDTTASCEPIDIFLGVQGRAPACDPFIRGMATALYDRYLAISADLLDGAFAQAAMEARIDQLAARIADEIAADPNGPTVMEWETAVEQLKQTVAAKRAHVAGKL